MVVLEYGFWYTLLETVQHEWNIRTSAGRCLLRCAKCDTVGMQGALSSKIGCWSLAISSFSDLLVGSRKMSQTQTQHLRVLICWFGVDGRSFVRWNLP